MSSTHPPRDGNNSCFLQQAKDVSDNYSITACLFTSTSLVILRLFSYIAINRIQCKAIEHFVFILIINSSILELWCRILYYQLFLIKNMLKIIIEVKCDSSTIACQLNWHVFSFSSETNVWRGNVRRYPAGRSQYVCPWIQGVPQAWVLLPRWLRRRCRRRCLPRWVDVGPFE